MRKINLKQRKKSIISTIGIGLVLSLFIITLGCICLTSMVLNASLEEDRVSVCACIILFIAAAVGSLVSTIAKGERLAITCLFVGVSLIVVLLGVSILFFNGIKVELSKFVALILGIIFGCICNLLTAKRQKIVSRIR